MRKRLVITGPESTGKSTLTEHLAKVLGLPAASEYARIYLEEHGPDYDYELLLELSRRHLAFQEEQVPPEAPLGLFDTDLTNYKIWCDVVFGRCHDEIRKKMEAETDHVYLLCYPDLPWAYDPLRENENDREDLFALHEREIERLGRPYTIVRGQGNVRFTRAETAARALLESDQG